MAESQEDSLSACPFCDFRHEDVDFLFGHVNSLHPDPADAPRTAVMQDRGKEPPPAFISSGEGGSEWVECDCGEVCLISDFSDHLALHEAENVACVDEPKTVLENTSVINPSFTHQNFPKGKANMSDKDLERTCSSFDLVSTHSAISPSADNEAVKIQELAQLTCGNRPQIRISGPFKHDSSTISTQGKRLGVSKLPFEANLNLMSP